jgi:dimethylargininase
MASVLREYRKLQFIDTPGTMDGGDVLVMGKRIYIGKSGRTNTDAIRQFSDLTAPYGYKVTAVPVKGCLHLKTAITPLETDLLLINPDWADPAIFKEYKTLSIHPSEPFGANVMQRENKALCPLSCPRTADLLHRQGYELLTVDQSELAKAEAGLTCCSVIVNE